ncbi:uncharacterized protein cal1 [Drosophila virilis]|uniref:Uncharacterized protein n=1 Tax=Drosophila virilis TaxID=7244 RepID=B4LX09_DROVI|nr:uncharacterized protein LOC6631116 [Drosophila virilis]EDW67756.1 uncharacterized protein Dvir_GJ22914 [Drosophila virilis]
MSQILVDEEALETLTYERSKIWSNFLKRCEENEEGEEIELNQIEELYKNQDEESIGGIEEAEEDDVENDINNTTACMSKAELTLMLCSGDNKEILNQTLPIVEEHVRKWKAAGLDRILNTFDAQKIEQHVGDWLRRHNSAYGDKTLLQMSPEKTYHKRCKDHSYSPDVSNESETESMHSVDTARYIRASRKRTASTVTKCSSPMTTIKMYRTVPRKRDELRAKYGCNEYNEEQEHRHHMQALRHRRDQMHRRNRERELIYHASPRHYPYGVAASFHGQQRRKQLRKRRDSSPLFPSSSSSEDEFGHTRCDCSACVRRAFSKTTHPYCAYRSYHSHSLYHHQRVELGSRSIFKRSVHQLRRQHAFEEDLRPRMLESDCNCCNKDRLCSNVVHIANSSTEEWLVENKSSPDPVQPSTPRCSAQASTSRSKTLKPTLQPKVQPKKKQICLIDEELEEDTEEEELMKKTIPKMQQLPEAEPKKKALVKFLNVEEAAPIPTPKAASVKSTSMPIPKLEPNNKELTSTTSLPEMSKESIKTNSSVDKEPFAKPEVPKASSHKKQPPKSAKKVTAAERNAKSSKAKRTDNTSREKPESTAKSKPKKTKQALNETDDPESDLRRALALSKQTYLEECKKLRQQTEPKEEVKAAASPQLPEQSSFNNQSVACNSTAMSNDTACARALKSAKKPIKRAASTSQAMIDLCTSDSPSAFDTCWNQKDGDADCTVVTSTTSCEPPATVTKTAAVAPRPNIKLTKKGILLYAPADRAQSCSSSNFTLTEHSLSPIIGQRKASKFFKYHVGSRSFDSRYSIYYRPTAKMKARLCSDDKSLDYESSSSSSSDDDIFDRVRRYGEVYSVLEKSNEGD